MMLQRNPQPALMEFRKQMQAEQLRLQILHMEHIAF